MNTIVEMIAKAILRGDKTFLGQIQLPSPQSSGTSYQQYSYARQAARKVYNRNVSALQELM